ncbi:MAG TPA: Ig-like domain-containing protein [Kofleriaceae bacterium]|nr:Ig-like domain-containing protein [Kofleriaceae bacterium]
MKLAAACVLIAAAGTPAAAEPSGLAPAVLEVPALPQSLSGGAGRPDADAVQHASAATVLYLNRCKGGCVVHKAALDDARTHSSTIPMGSATDYTLSEFAWGDDKWNAFMQCMREVYSPYAVTITDVQPAPGVAYNEGIVAGIDSEVGWSAGGVAPITSDCSPYSYVISYTFANSFGADSTLFTCAVAAQETGHAFGLDHSFSYPDGRSACTDPMSYRGDCGGQRFFRNEAATCGEYEPRQCRCGATQNTHLKLLSVLGAGTPITTPPVVTINAPAAGAQIGNGTAVVATASAQRGIKTVELYLNGYLWTQVPGVAWGANGQPESGYSLVIPNDVPDGVIDIVVKAKDDIEATTATETLTVTKGAPCADASTCLAGQRCDAGRCLWDPPVGELGDPCDYPQFCKNGVCTGTATETRCTQECIPNSVGTCPDGFTCLNTSATEGLCWPSDQIEDPGCCSTGNAAAAQTGLLALGLALVLRRRRSR